MSGITDAELVSALRRQMTIAAARQVAAAGNLANIDTPNFKAVEVSFAEALDSKMTAPVATQPGHLGQPMIEPDSNARSAGHAGAARRQHRGARSRAPHDEPRGGRFQRRADGAGREVPPGAVRD